LNQFELSDGIHYRYSDVAIEHYNNPKIQALFKEMAAQEDIPPDIKADMGYIRSGEGFARTSLIGSARAGRRCDRSQRAFRWRHRY
jgi:hypothetical protein